MKCFYILKCFGCATCIRFVAMLSEKFIFITLLSIITLDFLLERILDYLNAKSAKGAIPQELSGIYDEEKYARSQAYNRVTGKFSFWSVSFSFILTFSAIYFGWFGERLRLPY